MKYIFPAYLPFFIYSICSVSVSVSLCWRWWAINYFVLFCTKKVIKSPWDPNEATFYSLVIKGKPGETETINICLNITHIKYQLELKPFVLILVPPISFFVLKIGSGFTQNKYFWWIQVTSVAEWGTEAITLYPIITFYPNIEVFSLHHKIDRRLTITTYLLFSQRSVYRRRDPGSCVV